MLITGAGQGVGRGIALGFGAAGAEVVVNDIDADRAGMVVDEVAAAGGAAMPAVFDITDHAAVRASVDRVGGVDVLINNAGNAGVAGFGARGPFVESEPADWEPFLQVNLYGAMHCARAVLPGMMERGWGRLITIVSDAGRAGDTYMAAYSAAKAGAAGLTRALAREVGRYGVTANNISLGTMRTPMSEELWSNPELEQQAKAILSGYVLRRPGTPEDVAPLAVFLASDHSSWITGQTYPLNGGFTFAL